MFSLTILYLKVKHCFQSYFYNDDSFNFNYAQAKAAVGNFKEAEEVRLLVLLNNFLKKFLYHSMKRLKGLSCLQIATPTYNKFVTS